MTKRPRLIDNGDGSQTIQLGTIVSTLIAAALIAGGGALVTVGVLAYRASADEVKMEKVEIAVERQGRNQMRLDEGQRRIGQDTEHANLKLDALLMKLEVTERVPRPALPESNLEKPKAE